MSPTHPLPREVGSPPEVPVCTGRRSAHCREPGCHRSAPPAAPSPSCAASPPAASVDAPVGKRVAPAQSHGPSGAHQGQLCSKPFSTIFHLYMVSLWAKCYQHPHLETGNGSLKGHQLGSGAGTVSTSGANLFFTPPSHKRQYQPTCEPNSTCHGVESSAPPFR